MYDSPVSWGADLAALVRLTATGRLHPQIDHHLPWSRVGDALTMLAERRLRGKAVFHLGD
ncbi:Zinc-binding dehydrogenase [Streptoalloteichus hindustanus]|uniref:Zinc-binding dehydrogenase n=1 Tax=Streptoalloteichus hindustanus TaxID=2017 RepID=A0A1M4ZDR5_STRHI|nr:Zinc-binding dehydrogenase [Streptoalloteichus hindustanus]